MAIKTKLATSHHVSVKVRYMTWPFLACAWCRRVYLTVGRWEIRIPFGYRLFSSHGICNNCIEQERKKLNAF